MRLRKSIALCVFSFGIGFGSQFIFPNLHHTASDASVQPGSDEHGGHAHDHTPFEVPSDSVAPSIAIALQKDSIAGYNLLITTENFTFAPEKASVMGDKTLNEGHAHLYINGEKKSRIYGNAFHIPDDRMPAGNAMVTVSLNTNDHDQRTANGVAIQDSVIVEVPAAE